MSEEQERREGIQNRVNSGNPLRKYQETVTGSRSWIFLIFYELLEMCIFPLPGAFGRLLRSFFCPLLLGSCGKKVRIGKNVSVTHPKKIFIETGSSLEEYVALNVKGEDATIRLRAGCRIAARAVLSCAGGEMVIGAGSEVGPECRLGSLLGLRVGKNVHIGKRSYIIGAAHAYDRADIPIMEQSLTCRGVTIIEDDAYVGSGVTLRDGVVIGTGARIDDGALVLQDVAAGCHVAGVPAVILGEDGV